MISVDCSVLVKLLTNDDAAEGKRSAALFAAREVFIATSVLLEAALVLRHAYGLDRDTVARSLRAVLGLPKVVVQNAPDVQRALGLCEQGLDFPQALHLASSPAGTEFVTFDAALVRASQAAGIFGLSTA
jgi:predicted nucleic-acid-binding protein